MKAFTHIMAGRLFAASAFTMIALCAPAHGNGPALPAPVIDPASLTNAIHRAAAHLVAACQADGQFIYRRHRDPAVAVASRYNLLRHAGTLYALAQYDARYPDEAVKAAIGRGALFLKRVGLRPLPGTPDTWAIWSEAALDGGDFPTQAKLGGAGLGLAAFVTSGERGQSVASPEELEGLARFIRNLQKPDGSFHSKYIPSTGGADDSWESLYYPGEAALGLLMLHRNREDIDAHTAARRALLRLADLRRDAGQAPIDHWALLATALLLESRPQPADEERTRHLAHAQQIVASILTRYQEAQAQPAGMGGHVADGRTTPTAIALEGLLAIHPHLAPRVSATVSLAWREGIDTGIAFLLKAQVQDGPLAGAFPRAIAPLPEDHPDASAAFNRRAGECRIDYTQHALSALLFYEALPHE